MLNQIIYLSLFHYSFHPPGFVLFFAFVFAFLFHLLFLLSLTLITGIIYCLNYTSLLLHIITTHPLSHLSLSCIIFSVSVLVISIFYCLDSICLYCILCNTPCNRFYNNYVINIYPRQLLWFI